MDNVCKERIIFFQTEIISFWEVLGRHSLPWRITSNPWKLVIAEVLLRKTTSHQAEQVYVLLQNFEPHDIISIQSSVLESQLKPLGMNTVRAEQLKAIATAFSTASPEEVNSDEFLISLPGIGRYISNMVRCCAFNEPLPGLDTNMIRILIRYFGIEPKRTRAREDNEFWHFATTLVPPEYPKEYNWGIMDFGAAICTKRKPQCDVCGLSKHCIHFLQKEKTG